MGPSNQSDWVGVAGVNMQGAAMSEDFRKLIEDIEAEATAEGPAAEAELRELRREFSTS